MQALVDGARLASKELWKKAGKTTAGGKRMPKTPAKSRKRR
jgi:hypothetical protein